MVEQAREKYQKHESENLNAVKQQLMRKVL